ncbi:ABC transporter substrate-binding protein [Streptomyces sp. NPDC088746]|uniref:ABC transporter substrate-binding protein n=1 Tax=Streptomyces sp. NPDC088746 TaxID=3365885 RepID=UPI00381CAB15
MPDLSRRSMMAASGAGLGVTAALLSGCTLPGSGRGGRSRTLALSNRNSSMVRNFNVFSPASTIGSLANFVYEPALWAVEMGGGRVEPWLMKSYEWSDGGRALTLSVRAGVLFSDGAPFTAEDALYSFQLPLRIPETNAAGVTYTHAERSGPDAVTLRWDRPAYQELFPLGTLKMVPKRHWEHRSVTTWDNPQPVGTGPCTVDSFSTAQVRMKVRDDYWGGPMAPDFVSFRTVGEDNAKLRILAHELDFLDISWPGGARYFDARDPHLNSYVPSPNGSFAGIFFNHAKRPWGDVHVRRALNLGLDRRVVSRLVATDQAPANAAGLAPNVFGDYLLDEYAVVPDADADAAHHELARGGWKVAAGRLEHRDGRHYTVKLACFAGIPSHRMQAAAVADQWRRNLGVDVQLSAVNVPTLVDRINKGQFDLHLSPQGGGSIYNHFRLLMDANTVTPIGRSTLFNAIRWDDKETADLLTDLAATRDPGKTRRVVAGLQRIMADRVPAIPFIWSCNWAARTTAYWTGWPANKDGDSPLGVNSAPAAATLLRSLKSVAA